MTVTILVIIAVTLIASALIWFTGLGSKFLQLRLEKQIALIIVGVVCIFVTFLFVTSKQSDNSSPVLWIIAALLLFGAGTWLWSIFSQNGNPFQNAKNYFPKFPSKSKWSGKLGVGITVVIIIAGGLIWSKYKKKNSESNNATAVAITPQPNTITSTIVPSILQTGIPLGDLSIIHGIPDSIPYFLDWGANTLEPNRRYYFNNEIPFRNRLTVGDTLHIRNEGYEEHVRWDMAYDTLVKGTVVMNKFDDGKGWGCYYLFVDKEVETYIYSPNQ